MATKKPTAWSYGSGSKTREKFDYIPGTKKLEKRIQYINKDGKWVELLNPSQKGRKYAKEVKNKKCVYTGKDLSKTQLSFRSGYLKARSDNAGAYNSRKKKNAEKRAAKNEAKQF